MGGDFATYPIASLLCSLPSATGTPIKFINELKVDLLTSYPCINGRRSGGLISIHFNFFTYDITPYNGIAYYSIL